MDHDRCQADHDGTACDKPATHAILAGRADTKIRMCGPDARDAVSKAAGQGGHLVMVQLEDLAHWTTAR